MDTIPTQQEQDYFMIIFFALAILKTGCLNIILTTIPEVPPAYTFMYEAKCEAKKNN